jgi:hypothetical protein
MKYYFFLNVALCFVRTAMTSLSNVVIFVALATLFHQSSGNEHVKHIRDQILKAHNEAKERLAPSGKWKSLVSTRQTFEEIVSFLSGRIIIFNPSATNVIHIWSAYS